MTTIAQIDRAIDAFRGITAFAKLQMVNAISNIWGSNPENLPMSLTGGPTPQSMTLTVKGPNWTDTMSNGPNSQLDNLLGAPYLSGPVSMPEGAALLVNRTDTSFGAQVTMDNLIDDLWRLPSQVYDFGVSGFGDSISTLTKGPNNWCELTVNPTV